MRGRSPDGNTSVAVVVLNFNGLDFLPDCISSLLQQTTKAGVILVDNASSDGSVSAVKKEFPSVVVLQNDKNSGFSGGVNTGIRYAMDQGYAYVALLNNDAKADRNWVKNLVDCLENHTRAGIATGKFLNYTGEFIDSTGDTYSIWGLPYPRGRNETSLDKYDKDTIVFGGSGGASLYRTKMLEEIGLFDEDFFAYYEDVDISFRAQLAGWQVRYVPVAKAYHRISATNSKVKGFTTYHTLKNLPLLMWKNVPWALMPKVWPRLALAYIGIAGSALSRGQLGPVLKGWFMSVVLWLKKLFERNHIQRNRKVSVAYINSIITHDLPPNATKLRALRAKWWKLIGKS